MTKARVANIRNIAFCGHGAAGKTTLVDRLLIESGAATGHPSVDDGTSLCDFDDEERHHKFTIEAAVAHFNHGGKRFNVIDTPGYPDFIGQTIGALAAVETAAIVINAHSGIEANTRRVFAEAGKAGVARVIVINKMDSDNIDFPKLIDEIRDQFGTTCSLLTVPLGHGAEFRGVVETLDAEGDCTGALVDVAALREPLIESIIEVDEAVLERYFEGEIPTHDVLAELLSKSVAAGSLVPILCCAGRSGLGLQPLLNCLAGCSPSPLDLQRTTERAGDRSAITPDVDGPLCARVFKTRIDPFVQKLSYVRVLSGTLARDQNVECLPSGRRVKLGPLLELVGHDSTHVDVAGPGDIVAIAKMEDLHTGSILGALPLSPLPFPTPMVGLAVTPKNRGDETKLSGALGKIDEEDPTFKLDRDPQTKELIMFGMSELHLAIIQERLARRDKLDVETREPKIPYHETVQAEAEGSYRHKKQSGGRGQFGEVHIRIFPLPRGTDIQQYATKARFASMKEFHYDEANNFLWVDSIVGGVIPSNFMPAIEKGFKERRSRGVVAGYPIQNLCIEVYFGKHHPVDSSEAAFKTAASMAFRDVFQKAEPSLLEPIVSMAITVPEGSVGDVYSDMSTRRGRILGADAAGTAFQTVNAEVPLAEVTTYARSLSSMTGGQGSYTMDFSHYDVVPANVAREVFAASRPHEAADDE